MKKLLSILLALAMLLSLSSPVFAGQEEEGMVLSSYASIDREMTGEMMEPLGIDKKTTDIIDSALCVVNEFRSRLTVADNGMEFELFLNDTKLLDAALEETDQGVIILSSLFPDYALTMSTASFHAAITAYELISRYISWRQANTHAESGIAAIDVKSGASKLIKNVFHSILMKAPEKGHYDFGKGGSYNTRTQIGFDTRKITKALSGVFEKMSLDEEILSMLEKAADATRIIPHVSFINEKLPSLDISLYTNTDDNGDLTGPDRYLSVSFSIPVQDKAIVSAYAYLYKNDFEASLDILGNHISLKAGLTPFDESSKTGGSSLELDLLGRYFARIYTAEKEKDGSTLNISDKLYILDSEQPLAGLYTVIEPADVPALGLETGDRKVVKLENVVSGRQSEWLDDLLKSIRDNGLAVIDAAAEASPEAATLLKAAGSKGE